MRLGFVCEPTSNAYYRAIIPLRALERRGHEVVWPARLGDDVPISDLRSCDVVHCYRRVSQITDLRKLSERGVVISFDNDDNYVAAEVSEGGKGLAGHRYNKNYFRAVIQLARMADVTTTPSAALASIYRAEGVANVNVIENHLERSMTGFGSRTRHRGVVVGWVAGSEHVIDLERLGLARHLQRLLDTHSSMTVLSIGLRLPLRSERYEHVAEVAFPKLLHYTSRMDVGIAPLVDTAFNRSRSNVKLKEYSSGATAWLASPVTPYLGLGEAQGGQLVADDDWYSAMDALVSESRRRRRLAKRALRWAKQQTIEHHVDRWENTFRAALERRR